MCLLKRAPWFEEHLRFVDRGSASLVEESRLADQMAWQVRGGGAEALDVAGREQDSRRCAKPLGSSSAWFAKSSGQTAEGQQLGAGRLTGACAACVPPGPLAPAGVCGGLRPGRGRGDRVLLLLLSRRPRACGAWQPPLRRGCAPAACRLWLAAGRLAHRLLGGGAGGVLLCCACRGAQQRGACCALPLRCFYPLQP